MEHICTSCLSEDKSLTSIWEARQKKYFREIVVDFMEYELPGSFPMLCASCASQLAKAVKFREQTIHSFVILKEIYYKELKKLPPLGKTKTTNRSVQTETGPDIPAPDEEAWMRIDRLKMQNQTLLRLLKRLQRDSRPRTEEKKADEDSEHKSESESGSISPAPPSSKKLKSSTKAGDPNEALNRIKILDVRVMSEEFQIETPKTDDAEYAGPIVLSTMSLRGTSFGLDNVRVTSENTRKNETMIEEDKEENSILQENLMGFGDNAEIYDSPSIVDTFSESIIDTIPKDKFEKAGDYDQAVGDKIFETNTSNFEIVNPATAHQTFDVEMENSTISLAKSIKKANNSDFERDVEENENMVTSDTMFETGKEESTQKSNMQVGGSEFESDAEDDNPVIADDDPIWENLDLDLGYPKITGVKSEAMDTKTDDDVIGREQSVTPVTDDLMPDLQTLSDIDSDDSEASEASAESGVSGVSGVSGGSGVSEASESSVVAAARRASEACEMAAEESNCMDLSEYCNKRPVVILEDIMKNKEQGQENIPEQEEMYQTENSMLVERMPHVKRYTMKPQKSFKSTMDCSNCPHCVFMKKKLKDLPESSKTNERIFRSLGKRHYLKPGTKTEQKKKTSCNKIKRGPYKKRKTFIRRKSAGARWTVNKEKRVDVNLLNCSHCDECFESKEALRRHVFEVVGADEAVDGAVNICDVEGEVGGIEEAKNQEPTKVKEALEPTKDKEVLVMVQDVFKSSTTDGLTDKPELLHCNHCEKKFKTNKKLRDHILDIVLSDCNKSLDELWQTTKKN